MTTCDQLIGDRVTAAVIVNVSVTVSLRVRDAVLRCVRLRDMRIFVGVGACVLVNVFVTVNAVAVASKVVVDDSEMVSVMVRGGGVADGVKRDREAEW